MAEKGIIFSAPMVRALLDGRKTQTRRLIKLPDEYTRPDMGGWAATTTGGDGVFAVVNGQRVSVAERAAIWNQTTGTTIGMPYSVGDRLYVRESWHVRGVYSDVVEVGYRASENQGHFEYVEQIALERAVKGKGKWPEFPKYGPSIHMPRWASRLWLSVMDVRVQRLQDCTHDDAIAEGVYAHGGPLSTLYSVTRLGERMRGGGVVTRPAAWDQAVHAYEHLWDTLHKEEGKRWEDNPWVVAVSFEVHRGNAFCPTEGKAA